MKLQITAVQLLLTPNEWNDKRFRLLPDYFWVC